MKWEDHNRWAKKLGISTEAAQYVNRIVDATNKSELPPEYKQFIDSYAKQKQQEDGAKKGNSALHLVIAEDIKTSHDGATRKKTASHFSREGNLKFFKRKGEDYVKAWYLHHYLDHLHENRDLGKSYEQLLDEYSQPQSQEIEDFLIEHKDELINELNLPTHS